MLIPIVVFYILKLIDAPIWCWVLTALSFVYNLFKVSMTVGNFMYNPLSNGGSK